uniref:Uncharacterized protein n=1 Tax=Pseudomonas phage Cygsa01 TaxID=3138529 RepID=A0AAU6W3Q0_9VIRU
MADQLKAKLIYETAGNKYVYVVEIQLLDPRGAPIWCEVYRNTSQACAERFVGRNGFTLVAKGTRS